MPNVMAAEATMGGALCESSTIPFLVSRRKTWLTSTAGVSCSYSANTKERTTWTQSDFIIWQNSVRGQEIPTMYIQCTSPGDGQRSCKVWLACGDRHRRSNEAKKRNRLKFAGADVRHIMRTSGGHIAV